MNKLAKLIDDRAINKTALCKKAKVSRQTLENILDNNKNYSCTPSLSVIKKICDALEVDYKDYV